MNTKESQFLCNEGEGWFNIYSPICKFLFALLRFRVYIMQTLMELIKTCINKEPNANPNDVSLNASLSVFTIEAIIKALQFL